MSDSAEQPTKEEPLVGGMEAITERMESHANHAVPAEEGAEVVPQGEGAIKIGDKEFQNQKDAFEYAQQHINTLEQQNLVTNAYQQGIQETLNRVGQQQNVTPQAPPAPEENFDEKFYADPKAYLEQYGEKIRKSTTQELRGEWDKQRELDRVTSKFYSKYPNLVGKEKIVQLMATENANLLNGFSEEDKGMQFLASKVNDELKRYVQDLLPKQELPQTTNDASPGGQLNVTPGKAKEEKVDFISQLSKMQEGRLVKTSVGST